MWFRKKDKREEIDSAWILYIMLIVFIFWMIKLLIESWKWVFFVVSLLIGVGLYYWIKFINKKNKEKPASLPREFRDKYSIIPQYFPPKDLNPAEAWLLYNCKVDVSDLTSLVYQWAFEWLISIKNIKWKDGWKDLSQIELCKLKSMEDDRPFFEREIFNSIFSAHDKKIITNSFELRYALLLEDLEFHWIKKWWIIRSKSGKLMEYLYKILIVLFLGMGYFYFSWWLIPYFSVRILLLVLLLVLIFLWWYIDGGEMKLTEKWAKLAAYVIGYRNFIKSCDENIIKLYLKEDPLFIDKTLPYATAVGLETEFLKKITPLAEDWNSKYINWYKVTVWMKILGILLKSSDKNRNHGLYGW